MSESSVNKTCRGMSAAPIEEACSIIHVEEQARVRRLLLMVVSIVKERRSKWRGEGGVTRVLPGYKDLRSSTRQLGSVSYCHPEAALTR